MNKFVIILMSLLFISGTASAQTDFLVEKYLDGKNSPKPEVVESYDYSSTVYVPVKLKVCNDITTRGNRKFLFGEDVKLQVKSNVFYKNKLLVKKGTPASAKIEQIVDSGMNGIPYYIYLNNFEIEGLKSSRILSDYHKEGLNLVYWIYPLKLALTFLPPTGTFTNLIRGGHAKISTYDVITVYYFPEWE